MRRVGKIAGHWDHDGAASRNFAHAHTARPDRVGNAPVRCTTTITAAARARCPPYQSDTIQ
jgi:hypothetical protein